MRRWAAALYLLPLAARAEGAVLLYDAVGTPAQVTVQGRALRHAPEQSSSTLSRNLKRLLAANDPGAKVEVRFEGQAATVAAGHDGAFEVTFAAPDGGFPVGPRQVEAKVNGDALGIATVQVAAPEAPFLVVSDFDDTLAVTRVTSKRGLLKSALLQDEADQPVVAGMPEFYRCLRAERPAPPPFALVSGSPVQYLPRIRAFLGRHGFPAFGLYLRDLGPGTLQDYKQPVIRALLKALPQPVVLVGDSGERDPEVYGQIRTEFPQRVAAIYIRDAGRAADPKRFADMVLFKAPSEAARDAATRGLADAACVASAFAGAAGGTREGRP